MGTYTDSGTDYVATDYPFAVFSGVGLMLLSYFWLSVGSIFIAFAAIEFWGILPDKQFFVLLFLAYALHFTKCLILVAIAQIVLMKHESTLKSRYLAESLERLNRSVDNA